MKEKILQALQTRFEGVDEKTLGRIATKLAKTITDEADIQTAVDGVTIAQLMENYGDARATDATKTAVANYEKQHGLKDGKPLQADPPAEPKPGDDKDTPAWAKALQEKLEAQEKLLQGYQAERTGNSRKAKLDEMLKGAPDNVRKMYEANFASMQFESDDAFNAWYSSNQEIVSGLVNDYKAKGAVAHPPIGGRTERKPGEADPLVIARAEKHAEAAKVAPSVILGGIPNNNANK